VTIFYIILGLSPFIIIFSAPKLKKRLLWKICVATLVIGLPIVFITWLTDYYFIWEYTSIFGHILLSVSLTLLIALIPKSKNLATALYIIWGALVLFAAFVSISINILGGAFGTSSTITSTWQIEAYEVIQRDSQGWAGPSYTSYELREYKLAGLIYRRIGRTTGNPDECIIEYYTGDSSLYIFDKCESTMHMEKGR
jgi:hypothetical protein